MSLAELETPALIVDRVKLDRNLERMRAHIRSLGPALRPHVKTAKSLDVVNRAFGRAPGQDTPVTVSTLHEAEYFFGGGYTNLLYAVGIAPGKLAHVADLRRRGADVKIICDSTAAADAIVAAGRREGMVFPVLIEIDCDGHRSGIQPGSPALLELGRALMRDGAQLAGVMTHAGDSYNCADTEAIRAMAERERAAVVACAEALREAGLPCPIVSVGSTPTATFAAGMAGVTEVRTGVYMFFDLFMHGLGVCRVEDIALSVLTAVIGHQRAKNWIITDAGWMAMSRDRGTARQKVDQGYGVVCDAAGRPLDGLIVVDANQEHGIVARRDGGPIDASEFPVGRMLRILPNHACATAAQHARYHVVAGGDEVEAVWPRISGW